MAYKSIYKDIIFIEGPKEYVRNLGRVEYKKGLSLYNNQMKNLNDVKNQLAEKATSMGGNCIINFKYGQKNTSWLKSILLSLDDNVNWYGDGQVVVISDEKYKEIASKIAQG